MRIEIAPTEVRDVMTLLRTVIFTTTDRLAVEELIDIYESVSCLHPFADDPDYCAACEPATPEWFPTWNVYLPDRVVNRQGHYRCDIGHEWVSSSRGGAR